MYQFIIIDEGSGVRLSYSESELEARTTAESFQGNTSRVSVWKRLATLESVRSWK